MGTRHHRPGEFDGIWKVEGTVASAASRPGYLQESEDRTRLLASGLIIIGASLSHSLYFLVAMYFLCVLGAFASQIQIDRFLGRALMLVCVFTIPAGILGSLQFVTPGQALVEIGPVHFTRQGLVAFAFLFMRALVCVCATSLLVQTSGLAGIMRGLRGLHVPESLVAAVQLAFHHIHVLGKTAQDMVMAFRARALGRLTLGKAYSAIAIQSSVLLMKSMGHSRLVHQAMLARGFAGTIPTVEQPAGMGRQDWVLLIIGCAAFAGGLAW
ncbi:MAG: energy-coupling factor transporter transmembrane protein EcfT [Candidatus Sumerlaeaceae bacterium]|nr:energy-coupling factor transporter transmembrane protein EcfT [Candidatus Sumerlaeaceae bacterium]